MRWKRFRNIILLVFAGFFIAAIQWIAVRGSSAAVINVPDDYLTIQEAMYAAISGDTIRVAAGTYNEDIIMASGVVLQGDGADSTVIIGSGNKHVVEGANDSKIDGFTIHNPGTANAVVHGNKANNFIVSNNIITSDAYYASIYLKGCSAIFEFNNISNSGGGSGFICTRDSSYDKDSSIIRNNNISNCLHGIRLDYANTEIDNNTISDNEEVGIWIKYSSSSSIHDNIISRNNYFGIWCNSSPIITNNTIFDNYPCGIIVNGSCSPQIEKNIIYSHIYSGIHSQYDASPLVKHNLIFCHGHGGIIIDTSSPTIINNTISYNIDLGDPDNQGVQGGNGIYSFNGSSPTIKNNIITNNISHGIFNIGGGTPTVSYNDLWENFLGNYFNVSPGTDDISQDPLFENVFDLLDVTTENGTANTIEVSDSTIYSIGDNIEYNNDGVIREITGISGTTITFIPALASNSIRNKFVYIWGVKTDPTESFHLLSGSPCIDAGDPDILDCDGSRSDMGAFARVAPPSADFNATPTEGYRPLAVTFTDLSTGCVDNWSWDFGDGETSAEQNPEHTFNSTGYFTVSLTITGAGGSDVETKLDYIHVNESTPPTADFKGTPATGNKPLATQFTDLSNGTIDSWSWNFGDGKISAEQNPKHIYYATGSFTVSLTVTGPLGADREKKVGYIKVSSPGEDKGCFIATAAFGTSMVEEIQTLREFRDNYLSINKIGKALISLYYKHSPIIADFIRDKEPLKSIVRAGIKSFIMFIRLFNLLDS